jgi:hypothetical protein
MTDSYIGVPPQSGFISQEANQYFTGLTQNYIDLNQSISSLSSVIILVNGVVQENSTMSLTSSTRITLGDTLVSADKVTCIYVAKISSTQAPAIGSVTSDMLSGSIANSKLANSSITLNGSAVSLGGSASVGKALGITTRTVISQNLTSSTSFSQISDWNTSYTIQEVGSKIHIRLCGSIRNDGGGSGSRRQSIKINYHQNGGSDTTLINRDLGNGQNENGFVNLEGVFTATSTGACPVTVYHKTNVSGDTVRLISEFGISGQTGFLTITEYGT